MASAKQIDLSPLVVEDATLNVSTNIEAAPRGLMLRELIMNGMEASAAPGETERLITLSQRKITGNRGSKLAIVNTGRGMDADTLKRTANLNATTKRRRGVGGRSNRGEGAKIASLRFNPQGFSYVSRQEGELLEVLLLKRNNIWGRHKELIDGSYYEAWVPPMTAEDKALFPKGDFTMVTLYGSNRDHSTVNDPYGTGASSASAIADEVFGRFYSFSDIDGLPLPVKVFFDGTVFGGRTQMLPLKEVIAASPETYKSERIELGDGVVVEFVHAAKAPMFPSKLHAGSARCALVWHGEMYDVQEGISWVRAAINFGLMGLGKNVTVLIHLPNDYQGVHAAKYRDVLQYEEGARKGEIVRCEDFQAAIYAARPEWLRKLNAAAPSAAGAQGTKQRLEAFLRSVLAGPSSAGKLTLKAPVAEKEPDQDGAAETSAEEAAEQERGEVKPQAPKGAGRGAPSKKGKPLVSAPEVSFQQNADEVPDLVARAVCYSRTVNTIFINLSNPRVTEFVEAVLAQATTDKAGNVTAIRTPELVESANERVRYYIYEQVAKVVIRNLACQGHIDWDSSEIDRSLDKEALHNVVLASMDSHGLLARDLGNTSAGKGAKLALVAQNERRDRRLKRAATRALPSPAETAIIDVKPSDLLGLPAPVATEGELA